MKDLMRLQQEAEKIKKELENTHIEAEIDGVVVTVSCDLKIVSVAFENPDILKDQARCEKTITEASNKGLKKAQEIAAEKMKGVMSQMGMNLPAGMGV